jgi:hypothetical protein
MKLAPTRRSHEEILRDFLVDLGLPEISCSITGTICGCVRLRQTGLDQLGLAEGRYLHERDSAESRQFDHSRAITQSKQLRETAVRFENDFCQVGTPRKGTH